MSQNRDGKQRLWHVRRDGQVVGPFPSGVVRRYLVLGRLSLEDQVSLDQLSWPAIRDVPEVVPREIRQAVLGGGDTDQLLRARLREDERTGRDRRNPSEGEQQLGRVRQGERRLHEPALMQRHRRAKTELRELALQRKVPLPTVLVLAALVLLTIGYGVYLGTPEELPDPDCSARPAAGVNWRNCLLEGLAAESSNLQGANLNNALLRSARLSGSQLTGADLSYSDLSGADLSYAEMRRASVKGGKLRNADLSSSDLSEADLSYADLTGANLGGALLDGAVLDHAIWVDGDLCLPRSLGRCLTAE